LKKLELLDIHNNSQIDSGLEYLSDSISQFIYWGTKLQDSKELEPYDGNYQV